MYTPKHLKRWTMPESYFGATWPEYYSAGFGRSRDSDTLERSNFEAACEALFPLNTDHPADDSRTIQIVRENHWAVGWVEWIAIHESNEAALKAADALCERYERYPSLDDDRLSQLECDEAYEVWANASLKYRIEACRRGRVSIFAARHDYPPNDDNGGCQEYLLGY